jgi:lipopolysaccharide/colanic/teichoic acid biosynthesis glycosyltransferase
MTGSAAAPALEQPRVKHNRPARLRNVLLLAFFAPGIAELLSTSAPPKSFFVPWIFALFLLFYGGSAILIREATLRWNSGWRGILLLGAAFGILEEGIATRAFFDPAWSALGPMTGIGYWMGVNWTWMCDAILYHAVFSIALPILLMYQIDPEHRSKPWLGKWGLGVVTLLFLFAVTVFVESGRTRYPAPPPYLAACVAAIGILGLLAYKVKSSSAVPGTGRTTSARPFAILAFCVTLGMVLQIYTLPQVTHSAWVPAAALTAMVLVSAWLLHVWSGGELSYAQNSGVLIGALRCLALLGFFQEVNPSRRGQALGASLVSTSTLIGLYFLGKKAAREQSLVLANVTTHTPALAGGVPDSFLTDERVFAIPRLRSEVPFFWRFFEIGVASVMLVLTSPIVLILAIIIKRGTPGPALFFQKRVGVNGRIFSFVKFRTLYADARQRFPELYAYSYTREDLQDLKFKVVKDPRVTPQGRWMRTTTLDELPNFWNVLRGDMALVGPRPEIPEMLPYYEGNMLRKFSVRPGVTGLAQISGRGRLGFYETVELDVEYVNNRSLVLDLKIIFITAYKMVTRDGAF